MTTASHSSLSLRRWSNCGHHGAFVGAVNELRCVGRPGDGRGHPDASVLVELVLHRAIPDHPETDDAFLFPAVACLKREITGRDETRAVRAEPDGADSLVRHGIGKPH